VAEKVDGSCVQYKLTAEGEDPQVGKACADDVRSVLEDEDLPKSAVDLLVREAARLGDVGIVTTKVDGKWYISPSRTYSEFILTFTRAIQRSDIEAIVDEVSKS
jgi:hypothetical protein